MILRQILLAKPCYDFISLIKRALASILRSFLFQNDQILVTRAYFVRKMRRAVCTKARDVFIVRWWLTIKRNSSFKTKNCKNLSQARIEFKDYPHLSMKEIEHTFILKNKECCLLFVRFSVARVSPRSSKGQSQTCYRPHLPPTRHWKSF